MAFMRKKTPEELAAEEEQRAEAEARYREVVARAQERRGTSAEQLAAEAAAKDLETRRAEYLSLPGTQARAAFDRVDGLLQCSIEFVPGRAVVVTVVGDGISHQVATPAEVLNSIDREGWDLVTGSFVPGSGTMIGLYLFKRCPEHRVTA